MSFFVSVKNFLNANTAVDKVLCADGTAYTQELFWFRGTCIARKADRKLILPLNAITAETTNYVKSLAVQSSYPPENIFYVPQYHKSNPRHHCFSTEDVMHAFDDELNKYSACKSLLEANKFLEAYRARMRFMDVFCENTTQLSPEHESALNEALSKLNLINADVEQFCASNSICDVVDVAYFGVGEYDKTFRRALREHLNPSGLMSFLHFRGDVVLTDETICGAPKEVMSINDAAALLSAFDNGTIRRGMKFGSYLIMKRTSDYMQVGCNKYPNFMFSGLVELFKAKGLL